jgi:hypothetical protein
LVSVVSGFFGSKDSVRAVAKAATGIELAVAWLWQKHGVGVAGKSSLLMKILESPRLGVEQAKQLLRFGI